VLCVCACVYVCVCVCVWSATQTRCIAHAPSSLTHKQYAIERHTYRCVCVCDRERELTHTGARTRARPDRYDTHTRTHTLHQVHPHTHHPTRHARVRQQAMSHAAMQRSAESGVLHSQGNSRRGFSAYALGWLGAPAREHYECALAGWLTTLISEAHEATKPAREFTSCSSHYLTNE
jgi:hypothetical protein